MRHQGALVRAPTHPRKVFRAVCCGAVRAVRLRALRLLGWTSHGGFGVVCILL